MKSKIMLVTLISAFLLTGCSNLEQYEGYLIMKIEEEREKGIYYGLLVVSGVSPDIVNNKTEDDLIDIAEKRNGIWFGTSKDVFKEVETGQRVKIYFDKNQPQMDSGIIQLGAKKVDS